MLLVERFVDNSPYLFYITCNDETLSIKFIQIENINKTAFSLFRKERSIHTLLLINMLLVEIIKLVCKGQ